MTKKEKSSQTAAIFPILMALKKFKERGIEFVGDTLAQKEILSLLNEASQIRYSEDEIQSFISDNVKELNAILREHGFNIQLNEAVPFDLGVVTIMDLVANWLAKAEPANIEYEGANYPAAQINTGACIINNGDTNPLLMIRTNKGLCVFIQVADKERSGLELFHHVFEKARTVTFSETPCNAVVPLVDLNDQPDVSWLLGLSSSLPRFTIDQALQQNKLKLTLDGIHAESAVALGGTRGIGTMPMKRPELVVDKPFNIWLAYGDREFKYFPLFCAYVAPDSWK